MTAGLLPAASRLFGGDVAVSGGPVADLQGPLWPKEAALITRAVPSRRADFTAGRTAARAALRKADVPEAAILRGLHGAPLWPTGVVGSISHSAGFCLAVVARAGRITGLGVDIEPARALSDEIAAAICDPQERASAATGIDTLRMFGAKEAIYKAQFPLTGHLIGFDAVTVRLTPEGFTATWVLACGPFAPGRSIAGKQVQCDGLMLSCVTLTSL